MGQNRTGVALDKVAAFYKEAAAMEGLAPDGFHCYCLLYTSPSCEEGEDIMLVSVLQSLFEPLNLILMVAGVIIGIVFGAIPGLSNCTAQALLLPISFAMEPDTAIIFMSVSYTHLQKFLIAYL